MAKKETNIVRKSIPDAQLQSELIKRFESGNTDKGNLWELLGTKYKLQKQRYYKIANKAQSEWQQAKQIAQSEQIQANEKEGLKSGVKSKIERILFYQNEIDIMEKQLRGEVKFPFIVGSKIMNSHNGELFMLPVQVQNEIRQTIKSYQSEISKIESDYAPTKVANTTVDGKDVKQVIVINGKEIEF